jgi:PKD repeat protein
MRPGGVHWLGLSFLLAPFALAFVASVVASGADPRSRTYDHAPPHASFATYPSFGTAPLRVRLDASLSSDDVGITEYRWDFGDGSTATGQIVDHVFATEGAFHPRLRVVDAAGHEREQVQLVEAAAPPKDKEAPVARVTLSGVSGSVPFTVDFDASGSTDDHQVTQYRWTFDDGDSAEGVRVSHTFVQPGRFDAVLVVADAAGRHDSLTRQITVEAGSPSRSPVAAFSVSRETANAPAFIGFDASGSKDDRGVIAYKWDFGDGTTDRGSLVHHRYVHAGSYLANLTVYDASGQRDRAWQRIEIGEHPVLGPKVLFRDAFASSVFNSSWAITAVQTNTVHSGRRAIAVVPGRDGAFRMSFPARRLDAYDRLEFWINGRDLDRVSVRAVFDDHGRDRLGPQITLRGFVAGAAGGELEGAWRRGAIPLATLEADQDSVIGFAWQAPSDDRPAPFYLDDISLLPSDVNLPVLSDCSVPPPIRSFVTRDDGRLYADGVPFRAVGANMYYLQQQLSRHLLSGDARMLAGVRQAMDAAACAGVTVVRTMGFNDSPPEYGDPAVIQTSPGVYREEGLRGLDLALAEARAHHLRVILTLTNNWSAFGGLPRYAQWAEVPPENAVTTPEVRGWVADYARMLARRVNTFTGIPYREDPTILAVELVNELRCRDCQAGNDATDFQLQLAHAVAQAFPSHLIADGGEGFDTDASAYPGLARTEVTRGRDGTSFRRLAASPDIDLVSYHLYPEDWHLSMTQADAYIDAHEDIAHREGKVAYLGEFGEQTLDHDRSSTYDRWLDRVFVRNGGSLALVWQLTYPGRLDNDGFALIPGDSAVTIATIARRAHSLNASGLDGVSLAFAARPPSAVPASSDLPPGPSSVAGSR